MCLRYPSCPRLNEVYHSCVHSAFSLSQGTYHLEIPCMQIYGARKVHQPLETDTFTTRAVRASE